MLSFKNQCESEIDEQVKSIIAGMGDGWKRSWTRTDPAAGDNVGDYPVSIQEDDDFIYIEAKLRGFQRDEIDISLDQDLLSIKVENRLTEALWPSSPILAKLGISARHEFSKDGCAPHLAEYRAVRVERVFSLPGAVKKNDIIEYFKDGLLRLTLPKIEETDQTRRPETLLGKRSSTGAGAAMAESHGERRRYA